MKHIFLFIFLTSNYLFGQVIISTESMNLNIGQGCNSAPFTIEISEVDKNDFNSNAANITYSIVLPTGFTFVGTPADINVQYVRLSGTADGCTYVSKNITNGQTRFAFVYTSTNTAADTGKFVISNIIVRCDVAGSSGYILRGTTSATNALQNGNPHLNEIVSGTPATTYPTLRSHGYLTSMSTTTATINGFKCYEYSLGCSVYQNYTAGNTYSSCNNDASFRYKFNITSSIPDVQEYYLMNGNTPLDTVTTLVLNNLVHVPPLNTASTVIYTLEYKSSADGCRYQIPGAITVNFGAPPAELVPSAGVHDKVFAKDDDPVLLNSYFDAPPTGVTINYMYGTKGGVENIGSGNYLFTPSLSSTGESVIFYSLSSGSCYGYYSLKDTFFIYDPSEIPPYWVKITSGSAPFCEKGSNVTFRLDLTGTTDEFSRYWIYRGNTLWASGTSDVKSTGSFTFNPKDILDNYGGVIRIETYQRPELVDGTYYDGATYKRAYLSIFPTRDVKIQGLPTPFSGDTIAFCTSSVDTLYVRFSPENGGITCAKIKLPSDSVIAPLGTASGDPFFRKIVPADVFRNVAKGNMNTLLRVTYRFPAGSSNKQCPETVSRVIKFFNPVNVSYSITSPASTPYCENTAFTFQINNFNNGDKFLWNFGKGAPDIIDSSSSIVHNFLSSGMYVVNFKTDVQTLPPNSCNNQIRDTIEIGGLPNASFNVYKNFVDEDAVFHSTSTVALNIDAEEDTITSWIWRYDDLSPADTSIDADTIHRYSAARRLPYAVTHKVTAGWGCVDSITRYIPVFPIRTPRVTAASLDTFAVADITGWYNSGDYNPDTITSSWMNQTPPGLAFFAARNQVPDPIIPPANGESWITTRNAGDSTATYFNNEKSYLESPVFSLDSLPLPMMSMETFHNFDNLFDGAALQYTFCDSTAFGQEVWHTLGKDEQGLNWYNSATVLGDPGGVEKYGPNRFYGWTNDTLHNWQNSAFRLTELLDSMQADPTKNLIRFRVVLGTNNDNKPIKNKSFEGFAFDNFFVGQLNRKVLVEEFCDYQDYEPNMPTEMIDPQAVRVQYHVRSRRLNDQINNQNIGETGARQLYHGLWAIPVGVIDGILKDHMNPFLSWGKDAFFKRSLVQAPFDVAIVSTPDVANHRLHVQTTVTKRSTKNIKGPFLIHTIIAERDVVGNGGVHFSNVFRSFVPNAAGHRIVDENWQAGELVVRSGFWYPAVQPQSDLMIVSFIQDDFTKEVYQVNIDSLDAATAALLFQSTRSGQVDNHIREAYNDINLYPNPASSQLNVLLNGISTLEYGWEISDAFGRVVKSGTLPLGINLENIEVADLNSGVYQFKLDSNNGKIIRTFTIAK